jgi:hypothetical protein
LTLIADIHWRLDLIEKCEREQTELLAKRLQKGKITLRPKNEETKMANAPPKFDPPPIRPTATAVAPMVYEQRRSS